MHVPSDDLVRGNAPLDPVGIKIGPIASVTNVPPGAQSAAPAEREHRRVHSRDERHGGATCCYERHGPATLGRGPLSSSWRWAGHAARCSTRFPEKWLAQGRWPGGNATIRKAMCWALAYLAGGRPPTAIARARVERSGQTLVREDPFCRQWWIHTRLARIVLGQT